MAAVALCDVMDQAWEAFLQFVIYICGKYLRRLKPIH